MDASQIIHRLNHLPATLPLTLIAGNVKIAVGTVAELAEALAPAEALGPALLCPTMPIPAHAMAGFPC